MLIAIVILAGCTSQPKYPDENVKRCYEEMTWLIRIDENGKIYYQCNYLENPKHDKNETEDSTEIHFEE